MRDATTADRMFRRFDDIFETCGWRVLTLKNGKLQKEAFSKPGGKSLEEWIDNCPNADYAVLTYQGGAAWRTRLLADIGAKENARGLIESYDDGIPILGDLLDASDYSSACNLAIPALADLVEDQLLLIKQ